MHGDRDVLLRCGEFIANLVLHKGVEFGVGAVNVAHGTRQYSRSEGTFIEGEPYSGKVFLTYSKRNYDSRANAKNGFRHN